MTKYTNQRMLFKEKSHEKVRCVFKGEQMTADAEVILQPKGTKQPLQADDILVHRSVGGLREMFSATSGGC